VRYYFVHPHIVSSQKFRKSEISLDTSGSGYSKENLTADPVGGSRRPDTKNPKFNPCASLLMIRTDVFQGGPTGRSGPTGRPLKELKATYL